MRGKCLASQGFVCRFPCRQPELLLELVLNLTAFVVELRCVAIIASDPGKPTRPLGSVALARPVIVAVTVRAGIVEATSGCQGGPHWQQPRDSNLNCSDNRARRHATDVDSHGSSAQCPHASVTDRSEG